MSDTINELEQVNTIIKDKADTMYVSSPQTSYGIFCFNSQGDLFLNSDWGFYGYGWRAYGDNFREFLKKTNADYVTDKFAMNWNQNGKPKFGGRREQCVHRLVEIFLEELRKAE